MKKEPIPLEAGRMRKEAREKKPPLALSLWERRTRSASEGKGVGRGEGRMSNRALLALRCYKVPLLLPGPRKEYRKKAVIRRAVMQGPFPTNIRRRLVQPKIKGRRHPVLSVFIEH